MIAQNLRKGDGHDVLCYHALHIIDVQNTDTTWQSPIEFTVFLQTNMITFLLPLLPESTLIMWKRSFRTFFFCEEHKWMKRRYLGHDKISVCCIILASHCLIKHFGSFFASLVAMKYWPWGYDCLNPWSHCKSIKITTSTNTLNGNPSAENNLYSTL